MTSEILRGRRAVTALYVPGDRPDRFEKAYRSGADIVIVDLEDAVAPDSKPAARAAVVEWLSRSRDFDLAGETIPVRIQVRVNARDEADLLAVATLPSAVELRVPKVENPDQLDTVVALAGNRPITALIETPRGIENAPSIAAHPAVVALALGEADLGSELGTVDPAVMDYLRIRILVAARAAELPAPMLSVFPNIADLDALRADTERGRRLGFVGRAAVHPSQLAVIRAAFEASETELTWARAVLAAVEHGGVATLPGGEMVDAAMVGRARRILEP